MNLIPTSTQQMYFQFRMSYLHQKNGTITPLPRNVMLLGIFLLSFLDKVLEGTPYGDMFAFF